MFGNGGKAMGPVGWGGGKLYLRWEAWTVNVSGMGSALLLVCTPLAID